MEQQTAAARLVEAFAAVAENSGPFDDQSRTAVDLVLGAEGLVESLGFAAVEDGDQASSGC